MMDYMDMDGVTELLNTLIRIGNVSSVDYAKCTARVSFSDEGEVVSFDLPVLHTNTLQNNDFAMPDVGEDVLCLFLPSGNEEGFILGSFYAGANVPPESSGEWRTVLFRDGTRISYNRETHELKAEIEGTTITANRQNVEVVAPEEIRATCKNATVSALESVAVTTKTATVTATDALTANAGVAIVNATESLSATAPTATVTAKNITLAGDVTITGKLIVAQDVETGGVSLAAHTHNDSLGAKTTAPNA